jgi:delta 1-pyrroline-5-carboxylate dehydrogenase
VIFTPWRRILFIITTSLLYSVLFSSHDTLELLEGTSLTFSARPVAVEFVPVSLKDQLGCELGEVGEGNRKDVRNAVEAARAAESWGLATAHNRAQILYYMAGNLSARSAEFAERLAQQTGHEGGAEVGAAISRLFSNAAWADKYDGAVHGVPLRGLTIAIVEPIGVPRDRLPR